MKWVDTEDEFESRWQAMISKYYPDNLPHGHPWLVYIHKFRHQWSSVWVNNNFTAGMRSSQLSESLNSNLRPLLNTKKNLHKFFTHFKRLLESKRSDEEQLDFNVGYNLPIARYRTCPLVKIGLNYQIDLSPSSDPDTQVGSYYQLYSAFLPVALEACVNPNFTGITIKMVEDIESYIRQTILNRQEASHEIPHRSVAGNNDGEARRQEQSRPGELKETNNPNKSTKRLKSSGKREREKAAQREKAKSRKVSADERMQGY
ncbi:Protein FAR-RED IMPAIRED RESPONSE 1 [Linum perenne]